MAFAQALPCPCPGKELLPKSPGLGLNGASGGCRPGPPTPCPPAARPDVRLQIAPSPVQQLPVRTYLRGSHVRFTRLWASGTWRGGLRRGSLWPSHPRAAAFAGPSSQAAALGCAACAHSGSVHAARPAPQAAPHACAERRTPEAGEDAPERRACAEWREAARTAWKTRKLAGRGEEAAKRAESRGPGHTSRRLDWASQASWSPRGSGSWDKGPWL